MQSFREKIRIVKHWPLAATVIILGVLMVILLMRSLDANNCHLVYLLDDAYIHMAIAKNLSLHGVWGVTPYEFSSSSSSLLWTLLLAGCYWLFGVAEATPFILNLVFALLLLLTLHWMLARQRIPRWYLFAVLLWTAYVAPLPFLAFGGLEHVMHIFLTILFVLSAVPRLCDTGAAVTRRSPVALCIVTPLMVSARFEGLFLIAVIALLFALRRNWKMALAIVGLGILPVVVYALVSLSQGWSWLPNSVLLKGGFNTLFDPLLSSDTSIADKIQTIVKFFVRWPYLRLVSSPGLLVVTLASLLLFVWRAMRVRQVMDAHQLWLIVFLCTTTLHLQFAAIGRLYRYEGYLIVLGLAAIAAPARELFQTVAAKSNGERGYILRVVGLIVLLVFALAPLASRGGRSTDSIPDATANIYQQQYQMGRFVERFYNEQAVALNDIGAVNFMSDVHCLDLVGLASRPVFQEKRHGPLSPQAIAHWIDSLNVRVAIVYDTWFDNGLKFPPSWIRVGQWHIRHNVVCGSETVSFYATDSAETSYLAEHLRQFASELPVEVLQSGDYLEVD